ncbi:MAG: hypothetical protein H6684_00050 [Deltaproteobacteria bacterium]|nr:hypothetical protein [Deltaproteobacteria bacterium]MCB9487099.1 hypothetical protein [Deltaproteobacteria bacterium]
MSVIRKPEQLYDVRLVDRHRKTGVVQSKDYDKWLKDLADTEDNAEYITAEQVALDSSPASKHDMDDDDDDDYDEDDDEDEDES